MANPTHMPELKKTEFDQPVEQFCLSVNQFLIRFSENLVN